MRVHADRGGVDNRVERFRAKGESRDGFATNRAGKIVSLSLAPRADRDLRTMSRQRDGGGAGGTSGAIKEDAALGEMEFLFERAEDADVIGVRTGERAIRADNDGVDGADIGGEVVAMGEMFQDFLFVRNSDAEAANAEVRDGFQKVRQAVNEEWEIDRVHFFGGERGVMHQRRK